MELIASNLASGTSGPEQATAALTIDLDSPPVDPPDGCVNVRVWLLARRKFEEHRPTASGMCSSCPRWRNCTGSRLARLGLATAMGEKNSESEYWVAFAQIMPPDAEARP